jgi:selenocysteine lyase/cysteine desulfurase
MDKRTFLRRASALGLSSLVAIPVLGKIASDIGAINGPKEDNNDDDNAYWANVRRGYELRQGVINLENGFYCIMPSEVRKKYEQHIHEVNMLGAYYMRNMQKDNKLAVAKQLANLAGCDADELIITRNTTESLDMVISGFGWKAGDEAIMAHQDYGAMLDMFKQVARRHGVVNKIVSVPANPMSDEEVVRVYEQAITPNTRMIMVCHMINITGQVLPVRKICDMAHARGIQVLVDGAHAFAQLNFKIKELNCDYYGCSLHKWLSAPLGAGMLYVKRDHIPNIWPLFAEEGLSASDVNRLNHTGTYPTATDLTIVDAIAYYEKMGAERKEARLRYLQEYWTSKVRHLPHVMVNTPEQSHRACAIANVGIKGMEPSELAKVLLNKYNIYTVAIDNAAAGVRGVRVTPNVYTTTEELDELIRAITVIHG